ncbi:MAG: SGNH/GDSL hydrolase family protein [Anaerolineales bacterium]|jgi:hypothetical protein|nr:SGNH/GDSL hydrolase family protein [Anaerolineales bacterium]
MKNLTLFLLILIFCLTACGGNEPAVLVSSTSQPAVGEPATATRAIASPTQADLSPTEPEPTVVPFEPSPALPALPAPTATLQPTLGPEDWKNLPVIPEISTTAIQIYQYGVTLGNNPHAFSKIGDCGSTPAWFLGDFDRGPKYYTLGQYTDLEPVIEVFQGSYSRTSLAAKSGFNASSIFSPLWSDPEQCQPGEAPLACEYRVHRPSIAFIMLGSNDVYHPDEFEPQMRQIIELSISQGIIPILSTKADNLEGDGSINTTIARLAQEYNIPLWNYWRAVQNLPDQGLQEDGVHITWAANQFDNPFNMSRGWPIRNLNALQVLEAIWSAVSK